MGADCSCCSLGTESLAAQIEAKPALMERQQRVQHHTAEGVEGKYELDKSRGGLLYDGPRAVMRKARHKESGTQRAVKFSGRSEASAEQWEAEVELIKQLDHPHICRLLAVYESNTKLALVMECMTGGELFHRIKKQKRFQERDAADAAWQMLLALKYTHSHGIVHRDIKLEDFLYETEGSTQLKLIDFGFGKIFDPNTKMAVSNDTLAYTAPEVLTNEYTSQCDLWSFGVIVFILLLGYIPFSGSEKAQIARIQQGEYTVKKEPWNILSGDAQDFLTKLLVVKPDVRLTAEQALKHKWIQQRDAMETGVMDKSMVDALMDFHKATAFRRAAMNMMAWSLTNEERAKVKQAFIEMDTKKTGTVSLPEFKRLLEEKFHVEDEQARAIFQALDSQNKDGEIHYSEFLAALVSSRIAIHDGLLKDSFKRFDTDNTGFITVANLKEVLGDHFEGQEVEKMLSEADMTHDGQISYSDWIAFLRDGSAGEKHQEVASKIIDSSASSRKSHGLRKRSMDALKALPHEAKQKACCALL
mmetsp:Transcript_53700/g.166268  ORF Transcript_53700/g.166268 Transcript_53700/m.166268 type:complete len:530 (-) Transcript_53700:57-1646(-)